MFIYISSTEVPSVSCIENMFFSTDLTLQPSFQPSKKHPAWSWRALKAKDTSSSNSLSCFKKWVQSHPHDLWDMLSAYVQCQKSTYYELVGFSSTWLISFKDLVCWGARFLKWWKVGIIYPKSFHHPATGRQIREDLHLNQLCWPPPSPFVDFLAIRTSENTLTNPRFTIRNPQNCATNSITIDPCNM